MGTGRANSHLTEFMMKTVKTTDISENRQYYRNQLIAAFRYSRLFSEPLGKVAETVVDTPEFEAILQECAQGSFECARRAAEMAVVYLDRPGQGMSPAAWWRDLLNYERGCFLQSATAAPTPPSNRPRRGVSAVCMNFSWKMPELAARLQAGMAPGEDLRGPVTLLFCRTREGRTQIVEVGAAIERVFRATNGLRTVEQITSAAGTTGEATVQALEALADIGAVVPAMTAEEMTRLIEARKE